MLRAIGQDADAREAYEAALKIAEELQDLRGQAHASQRLGSGLSRPSVARTRRTTAVTTARPSRSRSTTKLMTDYVFETDLLIDGPRERRIIRWTEDTDPPADDVTSDAAAVCAHLDGRRRGDPFRPSARESRSSNDIPVAPSCGGSAARSPYPGNPGVLWRLISEMDGTHTIADILSRLPASERPLAARHARRAGRHRHHRRVRTARRPVPPSGDEEGRPAGRRPGGRRGPASGDGWELSRVSGRAPDRRQPIGPRSPSHLPRADPLASIPSGLPRPRPAPRRFRRAAPHRVRGHRIDAVGGT